LQLDGLYPAYDNTHVPGLEVSGIRMDTKEPVCALLSSQGYSEYVCVPEGQILPLPKGFDYVKAAALPEALVTCWLNLYELGRLEKADSVLIHGGSSGIGSFAIQVCKVFEKKVIATVGDDRKKLFCERLGVDLVANYSDEDFAKKTKALYGGVDLILDILGGKHLNANLSALKPNGTIVSIAVMAGSQAEINLASVLMKNITIIGSTLRSKTVAEKTRLIRAGCKKLYPYIESGKIAPIIDSVFKFMDFQKAFDKMRSREHCGKIVLTI
jgi:NADPH:quinone reductase-like Zn-dependent oxidoreductase